MCAAYKWRFQVILHVLVHGVAASVSATDAIAASQRMAKTIEKTTIQVQSFADTYEHSKGRNSGGGEHVSRAQMYKFS